MNSAKNVDIIDPPQHHHQHHQPVPANKWLENSFSLSDWTTEESIDPDSLKKDNKLVKKNGKKFNPNPNLIRN